MTRDIFDDSGRSQLGPDLQFTTTGSNSRYIAGPPLKRGTLYCPENDGTVLLAHAVLNDASDFSSNNIDPDQFFVIQGNGIADSRRFVTLPHGLLIAVPKDLIELVIRAFGENTLGHCAIAEARRVSDLATEVGGIGFWNQRPIHYRFLDPPRSKGWVAPKDKLRGRNELKIGEVGRTLQERLDSIDKYVHGYVGWLMSNQSYWSEQQQLLQEFQVEIATEGFPARGAIRSDAVGISRFHDRCLRHYARWILEGVVAPDFPVPVSPQFPNLIPAETSSGVLSHVIPAYFPVPGTGWVADMLSDARPTDEAMPQLSDWFDIIQKENASLNKISGYSRRLRLMHYWKGLLAAFPTGLRRAKKRLTSVFAEFLKAGDDTIKDDLKVLDPFLSEKWMTPK